MKIGILTQPLHNNYGGLLQNYALQQVLILAGHEPCTIDHENTVKVCKIRQMSRRIKAYLRHWIKPQKFIKPGYVPSAKEEAVISQYTRHFINKYICHSRSLDNHRGFREIAKRKGFQAYIVGSDQCWRPLYNKSFLKEMFLNFVEDQDDIKRIAYGASFGIDEWDLAPETMAECAQLVKKFDLITVREKSGIDLCRNHLGIEAKHVLDPTLLLAKEAYVKLVDNEHEPHSSGNLFYYLLDPNEEKYRFVKSVADQMELVPFTVMPKYYSWNINKDCIKKHIKDCVYPSVTSWLRAFMDAKMIIVDSFHGMVFSIIFNKPFWVLSNQRRGMSRFNSLLKEFDLEDRLIHNDQMEKLDIKKTINWDRVNLKKEEDAKFSISLLNDTLNRKL